MKYLLLLFFYTIFSTDGFCESEQKNHLEKSSTKNQFWSVGFIWNNFSYQSEDDYEFAGNNQVLAFGYGHLGRNWFVLLEGSIVNGPYFLRHESFNLDYEGTGADLWWGYSATGASLRDMNGGYGFSFGLNHSSLVGKNPYRKKEKTIPNYYFDNGRTIGETAKISSTFLSPGIFFCWLEPSRTFGPSLDQLVTRIEGYIFSLAIQVPLFNRYNFKYEQWQLIDEKASLEGRDPSENFYIPYNEWEFINFYHKGKLDGMTIQIAFRTLLGP